MSLRRPLLKTFAFLTLSAAIAIGVFVYTFDLNSYRVEIARKLETLLHRPVHLGEARLSLSPGLALSFADLHVGSIDSGTDELSADRLVLLLDPWPLLKGEITFREIALTAPHLTLTLDSAKASGSPEPPGKDRRGLLRTTLIHTLKIEDGGLRLEDRRKSGPPVIYEIQDIRGQLTDFSLDRPWHMDLSAALLQGEKTADLKLAGEIDPQQDLALWSTTRLDLHLEAQRLDPLPLLNPHAAEDAVKTEGGLSLQLHLTGAPASGLRLEGGFSSTDFSLSLPALYRTPLSFRQGSLKTTWTAKAGAQEFTDLTLAVDEIALTGNLSVARREGKPWIEGELSSPVLSLDRLRRFLPDRKSPSLAVRIRKDLKGGTLRLESLRFAGPPDQFKQFDKHFLLKKGNLSVQDAAFRLDQEESVSDISLAAVWEGDRLTLKEGGGKVFDSPFDFSGALKLSGEGSPEMHLSARGTASSERLLALVPAEKRSGMLLSGPVPVSLEVGGTFDRLMVDLQADLKDLGVHLADKITKPSGLPGSLFITGEISPGRLELSHSRLSVPPLEVRARGALERSGENNFSLVLDIAPLDLQEARFRTALLEKFSPVGKIAAHYEMEGTRGKIERRGGTISLRNFGIRIPGPVGDISQVNGEILLRENRAEASSLTGRIGSSLVEAEGTVENFSDPRLELGVRGKAIRANDLIFPSDRIVLRDVDGHLIITRKGIDFAPVTVRLDGGTRATVSGTLRNFKAPDTKLEISAEYGNIDEVIALWHHSPDTAPKEPKKRKKVSLFIDAKVKEGVLGPLHFQDAGGEITWHDGILNIFPLRFSADSGSCIGQVVMDGRNGPTSLLKISGHMEDIDAAGLHHELLKKRGLVTGILSGDFYLEGQPGSEFLSTSLGGFDIKIRDGVLLKFKFLSKVFSLLNVSQILTLKLPDMDEKGMPFERLTGTFGLNRGVLSTEDLFIKSNSMNLSLVGDIDLGQGKVDLLLGVKPLRTVDKIVTQIPIAGWLLTGEEKALITAHFHIKGRSDDPEVIPVPITSVSKKVLGIFRRVLELPGKVVTDVEGVLGGEKEKKD